MEPARYVKASGELQLGRVGVELPGEPQGGVREPAAPVK